MHRTSPRRRTLLLALAAAPLAAHARGATPPEVAAELPAARLLGQGRLRFLGVHVYDAMLWVDEPFAHERLPQQRLALELRYARRLVGRLIAERSLAEMRRVAPVADAAAARWLAAMRRIFPDVAEGDRITGVQQPPDAARFYLNGAPIGELRDAEFMQRFFGIWLAPQTSEPRLRQALLGLDRAS